MCAGVRGREGKEERGSDQSRTLGGREGKKVRERALRGGCVSEGGKGRVRESAERV